MHTHYTYTLGLQTCTERAHTFATNTHSTDGNK
jgi:hypothetical protein